MANEGLTYKVMRPAHGTETWAGVTATIIAMKQGNACGAKGGRKVDTR